MTLSGLAGLILRPRIASEEKQLGDGSSLAGFDSLP